CLRLSGSSLYAMTMQPPVRSTLIVATRKQQLHGDGAVRTSNEQQRCRYEDSVVRLDRYSVRIPASLITFASLGRSSLIFAASASGELPTASAPKFRKRSFPSGVLT